MPLGRNRLEVNISSTTSKRTGLLVMIPRRRKLKNYISRRRNNQTFVNLRHCSSDPNLYKSYHEWDKLVKTDNFFINNIEKVIKNKNDECNVKNEIPSTSQKLSKVYASPKVITTRRLSGDGFAKAIILSNQVSSIQEDEKNSCPKFSINTIQNLNNSFITEKPLSTTSVRRFNFKKIVKPFIDASCAPSTSNAFLASDLYQDPLIGEKNILKDNDQRIKFKPKAYELAQIKKELLESGAKIGANLSKKSLNIQGKQQSKEEIDDAKAKITVNAVTAAFSSKIRNNEEETNINVFKQPLTSGVAKKPPASPSMVARRFTIKTLESNSQLNDTKISLNKLKNVAPTSIILYTSYKDSQKKLRKPQKLQAESSFNKINDLILLKSQQEDDFSNMDNSISIASAIVPVLNLSHQKTPSNHQSQQHQQKQNLSSKKKLNTSSLLASLQLPPSVSAKVDKIIAGSEKKFLTVCIACFFNK